MSPEPKIAARRRRALPKLFDAADLADDGYFDAPFGLFSRQKIKAMAARKLIQAEREIEETQFQPASLDLRLGREAYRVRASFLPGRGHTVRERLQSLNAERISLAGDGAVLEKGIVYVAPLLERLELRPSLSGAANPKSSTGRLDIFTRLIVDGSEAFDEVAARLSRRAVARNLAAQLQRQGARRFAAQSGALPQPQFAAPQRVRFRHEGR